MRLHAASLALHSCVVSQWRPDGTRIRNVLPDTWNTLWDVVGDTTFTPFPDGTDYGTLH